MRWEYIKIQCAINELDNNMNYNLDDYKDNILIQRTYLSIKTPKAHYEKINGPFNRKIDAELERTLIL